MFKLSCVDARRAPGAAENDIAHAAAYHLSASAEILMYGRSMDFFHRRLQVRKQNASITKKQFEVESLQVQVQIYVQVRYMSYVRERHHAQEHTAAARFLFFTL